MKARSLARLAAAGALLGSLALPGMAHAQTSTWQAPLSQLNGTGTTGTAMLSVEGNDQVSVTVKVNNASPDAPHAEHIHLGGRHECPTASADANGDGYVDTAEGGDAYGGVKVSLTTSGDVSADSALAVDRFPTSNGGSYTYQRTFTLPDGVSVEDLKQGVVVVHGADLDNSGKYDGDAKSSLDDSLPLEATIPAACGQLAAMPAGGVQTGGGGMADAATHTNGTEGGVAALTALGIAGLAGYEWRRRTTATGRTRTDA